jgi:hypothetical protein
MGGVLEAQRLGVELRSAAKLERSDSEATGHPRVRSHLESSPGQECWLCGPPHIGQELCRDYVVDLFDA